MKKGDLKKQEILRTAEKMFCRNGFTATSVQDILDELHTSKGSFYHHFVSKGSVLEEICARHAAESAANIENRLSDSGSALRNLNMLLSGMIPLNGDGMSFFIMLLPVFQLTEGIPIKSSYCRELSSAFVPGIARELKRGAEDALFCVRNPDFAAQITALMINDFWCSMCDYILKQEEKGKMAEPGELLGMADEYRMLLERMLYAPYGSICLIRLEEIALLTEKIHRHWK